MATPRMMARVLATFYVAAGIAGLLAVFGPDAATEGRWAIFGLAIVVLACGAVAFRWGPHWPRRVFHWPVASAAGLVAVAVTVSPDAATAMAAATIMAFVAVDACFFFSLPLAWLHMAFGISAVTAALLAQGDVPASIALGLDAVIVALGSVVRGLVIRASSASRDPLTGLANRRGFDDALHELRSASARIGEPLSAALVDLDHFKQINDTAGHEAGDRVLCRIADVWRRELPPTAVFARHGGDEFALLLPGVGGAEALTLVRRTADRHPDIGISCGVAEHRPGEGAAELMRRADRALYDAKAAGRGRCELEGGSGSALAHDLSAALAAGEVAVHYQPIVALPDGAVVGVEALARWTHPEHGPIPPEEFVAVAEQNGLILALGAHVLRTACAALAGVRARAGVQVTLGVNVSGRELNDPDCAQRVQDVLAETGFPAGHLVVEVTESMLEGESPAAVATLHALRAAGVVVSIDDFGTGYSSLSRLDTLPADVLKLDRSFIATVASSPRRAQMLQSLVAMCRGLGLDVVAEGVETAEQEAAVRAMGCTFAQGWRYGRPVPLPDLLAGLRTGGAHHVLLQVARPA
ncbi:MULTISPECIES: putative bifunctional diguanylate cyclase/phosphodiesterase [unclassified Modestobacter]|uniref:putative bifunctional diguanylate cyclase/phosphodiesterase n=1 Tax=unclassified Modestobacter TaxID=2643866 RepID=UPI0022AA21C2|nr:MULTISPECIES: bifunctional diguanylate cyclase/phosphodiesterase [unclassified Modestobacter]MCZ2826653.1 bifunctional diguanylate cyclase/phosphodiesterase [Modestobacter sp. VKM Ac-2981]MCZ2855033.1 bifunctional diguanylate cyclase/phosphodiesterase [Modestobacter sp. VKM Ac-2982]